MVVTRSPDREHSYFRSILQRADRLRWDQNVPNTGGMPSTLGILVHNGRPLRSLYMPYLAIAM